MLCFEIMEENGKFTHFLIALFDRRLVSTTKNTLVLNLRIIKLLLPNKVVKLFMRTTRDNGLMYTLFAKSFIIIPLMMKNERSRNYFFRFRV